MSSTRRWLLWIGGALVAVGIIAGTAVAILMRRAEPMLRASLIDSLQKRFHSRVELDDLHVSVADGFQVEGSGLRIWLPVELQTQAANAIGQTGPNGAAQAALLTKPWITAARMHFHASWRILPGKPIVLSVIHVEGVQVLLPPKQDRPHLTTPAENSNSVQGQQKPGFLRMPAVQIQRIECQDALLEIERTQEPGKPEKMPLDFEFKKATLIPDGRGGPVAFTVDMTNAKPVGNIISTGHAGPWSPGDPGALPVEGDYKFDHADLSTIKGIAGMLSSTGHYAGTLRRIETDGTTDTPDFRLARVSRDAGVRLTTHFHAIVDGTNGNTWLQPVDAMLGRTHIVASGQVLRVEQGANAATGQAGPQNSPRHGHDIVLEVTLDRGRIEDILKIAVDKETPFMTGNLMLKTHLHLPPGQESVWDKLLLNGEFSLSQARFSSQTLQGKIVELSLRGQGKPMEAKTTDPTGVESDMRGHFTMGDGKLGLPDLEYDVTGAKILMHGDYGLRDGSLAFDGDAKLDASLSEIIGGWKGFLLKPADRLLRKNGAGTDVPVHVSGTRKQPKFGVDFDRLGKTDHAEEPAAAAQR